jgi:hypothetical protein
MKNDQVKGTHTPISLALDLEEVQALPAQHKPSKRLRAGDLCPQCMTERMDYDGLLNLSCPKCRFALGGCFT